MSKVIYVCVRDGAAERRNSFRRRIETAAARLSPGDGARKLRHFGDRNIIGAILNPSTTVGVDACGVCLGHVQLDSNWSAVGSESPDGTFAICRADRDRLEILADTVGSRTLWYYADDSVFAASTSQRWIAATLADFDFNADAVSWFLATGSLGPSDGWDSRLSRLQADSKLTLDLRTWKTVLETRPATFTGSRPPTEETREWFRSVLLESFQGLGFDYSKWVLPLSGGYDSRAILSLLNRTQGLRAITWGTAASLDEAGSDAYVARQVAQSLNLSHEYFIADETGAALSEVFDRFVAFGESRLNHISAYLDGFSIWYTLLGRGIEGIIRGDEGFGWRNVATDDEARRSVGLNLWEDYENIAGPDELGLHRQEMPDFLRRETGEGTCLWRDRLYHQYRIPTILAALTDLKAPFVEVANPLLNRAIIEAVRELPDEYRTDKSLFRTIMQGHGPALPYASIVSIPDRNTTLQSPQALRIFEEMLSSESARRLFAAPLRASVQLGLSRKGEGKRRARSIFRRKLRNVAPKLLRQSRRKDRQKPKMDFHALAFRMYLTCGIDALIREDVRAVKK